MICSALLETDKGLAVLGFRESALREIDLDPSDGRDVRDAEKLELIFVMVLAKSGCIMGRLPMTTATNVSLTAQLPACCAPSAPAYKLSVSHMPIPLEQDFWRTHGKDESASKDSCHHDEYTPTKHNEQPSLSFWINACLPEKLHTSQHDGKNLSLAPR